MVIRKKKVSEEMMRVRKIDRVCEKYKGRKAWNLAKDLADINARCPEGLDKALAVIKSYGSDIALDVAHCFRNVARYVEKKDPGEFDETVKSLRRYRGERAANVAHHLGVVASHNPKGFYEALEKLKKERSRKVEDKKGLESKVPVAILVVMFGIGLYFLFSKVNLTGNIVTNLSGGFGFLFNFILVGILGLVSYFYFKE